MRRLLKWFWMLSKRLYKKPSFVALLILIPVCVAAFTFAAAQDSGFLHIVLAQENKTDALSTAIIQELKDDTSLLRFTVAETPDAAIAQVQSGAADEAWIFPADTQNSMQDFLKEQAYIVSVVVKEQTVPLRLAREKLTAGLYRYAAEAYYTDYVRTQFQQLDHVTDADLAVYFENAKVDDELFVFKNPVDTIGGGGSNYLTSPVRGLLAIVAVLCGMASTLYYMQDEAAGTFSHVKQRYKEFTALGCIWTAVLNVSVFLLASLAISSLVGIVWREITALLLYTVCCAAFCLALKQMFGGVRAYAAVIPLLTVVFIGVCPVFFNIKQLLPLQLLFPPTYYINAVYDMRYCGYMAVYAVACLAVCALLRVLKTQIKRLRRA